MRTRQEPFRVLTELLRGILQPGLQLDRIEARPVRLPVAGVGDVTQLYPLGIEIRQIAGLQRGQGHSELLQFLSAVEQNRVGHGQTCDESLPAFLVRPFGENLLKLRQDEQLVPRIDQPVPPAP